MKYLTAPTKKVIIKRTKRTGNEKDRLTYVVTFISGLVCDVSFDILEVRAAGNQTSSAVSSLVGWLG